MNKENVQEKCKTNALFTVRSYNTATTQFSWDFIFKGDNSIVFAGKTCIQTKRNGKKLCKASELITKPNFIIETASLIQNDYTYLPNQFLLPSYVEVRNIRKTPLPNVIAWFSHIAPLLLAIEHKDSLLTAEIFHKHASTFMQFPVATMKLLESASVEGLFSWIWGRFDEQAMKDLQQIFKGKCTKKIEQWGVAEAFFTSARRRFNFTHHTCASLDECMIRYIKNNPGTKLTLGVVGSNHYRLIEKELYDAQEHKKNIKAIFSTIKTTVHADTNNIYDKNALAVFFENALSGYIRKTGAELLRNAFPNKMHFNSRLARLGYTKGGSTGIVVEIVV